MLQRHAPYVPDGAPPAVLSPTPQGLELQHLVTRVPAPFNRLTVFDPRFPHGVRQVHGTRDPRKGRLVLHGERGHGGCRDTQGTALDVQPC